MSPLFHPRRPIWDYPDKLRVLHLSVILGFDFVYGMVFALGGKAESVSQLLLKQLMPIPVWGAALALAAVASWIGYAERGGIFCCLAWLLMAIMSAVAVASGKAPSSGGPLIFGFLAAVHIVTVYGAASQLAQRTPMPESPDVR